MNLNMTGIICSHYVLIFTILTICWCVVWAWNEPSRHPYVDPIDRDVPWTSFQLTFILERGTEECFFQRVRTGFNFQLHYHASSRDVEHNMKVHIKTDRANQLYISYTNLEDEFEKQVDSDGIYIMCFANYASRFHAKKVSMTIDMFKEQKLQEYFLLKEETEGHLKNASLILEKTWRHLFHVSREQYMLRFSTEIDTILQVSNAEYIMYWSIAQAIIIVLAGIIQVWTLRSFFNAKTLTPSQKPRC